uniref:Uncharacterized protein n=1 Tax=Anguilla anguilla TaxID=7936 RepID=A0A0E9R9S6_ANGAN
MRKRAACFLYWRLISAYWPSLALRINLTRNDSS